MKVYWPADKQLYVPDVRTVVSYRADGSAEESQAIVGGKLVHHPARTPFEMPDGEALDRIRQGDCLPWTEDVAGEPVDVRQSATGGRRRAPLAEPAPLTGQQVQEG